MRQRLQVSALVAAAYCLAFAAAPARAGDGVVLVGCDLFINDGPTVAFVQSHGVSKKKKSKLRLFVGGSGLRAADVEGRPCAEVLSQIEDDGLAFKAMDVFGPDRDVGIWFFEED